MKKSMEQKYEVHISYISTIYAIQVSNINKSYIYVIVERE